MIYSEFLEKGENKIDKRKLFKKFANFKFRDIQNGCKSISLLLSFLIVQKRRFAFKLH